MENVQLYPPNENVVIEDIHTTIAHKKTDHNSYLYIISNSNRIILAFIYFLNIRFKYNQFAFIKPSEVKQYLFKVTYKDIEKEPKPLTVGKLDINWRNSFGEIGHLQTHPLSQSVSFKQKLCFLKKK